MLKALELRVPLVPTSWDLGHGTPADFLTNTIYYDVYRIPGNARALKSCSSVMQQSVSIRRPLLVSGRYVLVNIILDMSLAYGLTTRPRANTIIDTVTYLVDGTYRRWFWEVF